MNKSLNALENEFASIRAGRANPGVLDKVMVDYYGAPTPVNQMAAVSVSEARILVIQPWDKSTLKLIEKAIQASDIGIQPVNDGNVIRLAFPQLTEDRRKELCKSIKKYNFIAESLDIESFIAYKLYNDMMFSEEEILDYTISGETLLLGNMNVLLYKE